LTSQQQQQQQIQNYQRPKYHEPRFYDPELMKAEQSELKYDFLTPQIGEYRKPPKKYKYFENVRNPYTGEIGGPSGPEPTRYGDWERFGRVSDF
jgi:hypothetical protein